MNIRISKLLALNIVAMRVQVHANVISHRAVMISYDVDFDDAAVRRRIKW
jgi:hypothetical protein